jgi:hypothetical protein
MHFYPAALPLWSRTLNHVAGVIRRHSRKTGSRWRKLNPGQQALVMLAYLRNGETFAGLAAGFGIGTATAAVRHRDRRPAGSPRPEAAPGTGAGQESRARLRRDRRHLNPHRPRRRPAVLLRQAPPPRHEPPGHLRPRRRDPLVSGPLPGAVRDLTAARSWGITRELAAPGLIVLAGKGYRGADDPAWLESPLGRGVGDRAGSVAVLGWARITGRPRLLISSQP